MGSCDALVSVEREWLEIGRDFLGHDDDDGERGRKSCGVCQDRTPHGVWLGLDDKHAKAIVLINPIARPDRDQRSMRPSRARPDCSQRWRSLVPQLVRFQRKESSCTPAKLHAICIGWKSIPLYCLPSESLDLANTRRLLRTM